jgi:hypothetical protein
MRRFFRWLFWHRHKWFTSWQRGKSLAFHVRQCARCGDLEVEKLGPLGDRSWGPAIFRGPFAEWEREEFLSASPRIFVPAGLPEAGLFHVR